MELWSTLSFLKSNLNKFDSFNTSRTLPKLRFRVTIAPTDLLVTISEVISSHDYRLLPRRYAAFGQTSAKPRCVLPGPPPQKVQCPAVLDCVKLMDVALKPKTNSVSFSPELSHCRSSYFPSHIQYLFQKFQCPVFTV